MTRYDSFFIKLDEDSYLTEEGWRIEVKAVDGFLIWAKPSSGYYNQPCDRVYLGVVERAHTHGTEYTILMVRDISVSEVSPVEDGSIAEAVVFPSNSFVSRSIGSTRITELASKNFSKYVLGLTWDSSCMRGFTVGEIELEKGRFLKQTAPGFSFLTFSLCKM